jgi:hypothetical protein
VADHPAAPAPHAASPPASLPVGPIVAPPGESAAAASHPDQPLEGERWHIYESNPAPWWIGLLWLAFFVFAVFYLIVNLLR